MTNLTKLIEQRQGEFDSKWFHELQEWGREPMRNDMVGFLRQTATLAYRQALQDVLAGLPEEKLYQTIRAYDEYVNGFTEGETNSEYNTALQTVRAQIEGLLGKIE